MPRAQRTQIPHAMSEQRSAYLKEIQFPPIIMEIIEGLELLAQSRYKTLRSYYAPDPNQKSSERPRGKRLRREGAFRNSEVPDIYQNHEGYNIFDPEYNPSERRRGKKLRREGAFYSPAPPIGHARNPAEPRRANRLRREGAFISSARPLIVPINGLPMELVLEIAGYLHPRDMLSFSRVSKHFHKMIASKNAQYMWKSALSSVPLADPSVDRPLVPADLNEMQFTNLLFGTRCLACDSDHRCDMFWTLRVRLCKLCQPTNLITAKEILDVIPKSSKLEEPKALQVLACVPSADPKYRPPWVFIPKDELVYHLRDESSFIVEKILKTKRGRGTRKFDSYLTDMQMWTYDRIKNARAIAMAFDPESLDIEDAS